MDINVLKNKYEKLPLKIKFCPILQASLCIQFETQKSNMNKDLTAAILFNKLLEKLKDSYNQVDTLPIFNTPEEIRLNDEAFEFEPYYQFTNKKFVVELGPKIFYINYLRKYESWNVFYEEIKKAFDSIYKSGRIKRITKISIKYLDFFKSTNIFDKIKINVNYKKENDNYNGEITDFLADNRQLFIKKINKISDYVITLLIQNNFNLEIKKKPVNGSIIEIEISKDNIPLKLSSNDLYRFIDELHIIQKSIFYEMLNENFLKNELKPVNLNKEKK